jgi:hypothetical protein
MTKINTIKYTIYNTIKCLQDQNKLNIKKQEKAD